MDPANNVPGTPFNRDDPHRQELDTGYRKGDCVTLDDRQSSVVHNTIKEVAKHRDWKIHALNVRTNHVHIVVSVYEKPEQVMNSFKSWSTRRMVEAGVLASGTKTWTRHGSTRYLWKEENVQSACQYVCEGQGPDLNT